MPPALERFPQRFPTIAASLTSIGLDPETDWLPIAPAAHHLSGGVVTDLWGATALPGLWAVGEVACTGVHGANRLASNSLLEGMVFGARLAERIASPHDDPEPSGALRAVLGGDAARRHRVDDAGGPCRASGPGDGRARRGAGPVAVRRGQAPRLAAADHDRRGRGGPQCRRRWPQAAEAVADLAAALGDRTASVAAGELGNLVQLAEALLASAETRTESRGAHSRSDFPETDPRWRRRLVHGAAAPAP